MLGFMGNAWVSQHRHLDWYLRLDAHKKGSWQAELMFWPGFVCRDLSQPVRAIGLCSVCRGKNAPPPDVKRSPHRCAPLTLRTAREYQEAVIPLRFLLLMSTMIPLSIQVTMDTCQSRPHESPCLAAMRVRFLAGCCPGRPCVSGHASQSSFSHS
eukprot:3763791-Rhodomonas_salina.2